MESCSLFIFQYIHSQISWHTMKIDILMQKHKSPPILAKNIHTWCMQATEKEIKKFLCGTSEIFTFIRFGSHGQARINLKFFLGYNINFLSIWPFMHHPCFPPKRSQKWHFSSISSKIATALFRGYFSAKRGKMTLLRPFRWENMDDV